MKHQGKIIFFFLFFDFCPPPLSQINFQNKILWTILFYYQPSIKGIFISITLKIIHFHDCETFIFAAKNESKHELFCNAGVVLLGTTRFP